MYFKNCILLFFLYSSPSLLANGYNEQIEAVSDIALPDEDSSYAMLCAIRGLAPETDRATLDLAFRLTKKEFEKNLSESEKAFVESVKVIFKDRNFIRGEYDPSQNAIEISMPNDFRHTALYHAMHIHGLVHVLQSFRVGPQNFGVDSLASLNWFNRDPDRTKLVILQETQAMSWEWMYLHSLPPKQLTRIFSKLKNYKQGRFSKEALMIWSAQISIEDFLKSNREFLTYTTEDAHGDPAIRYARKLGAAGLACATAIVGAGMYSIAN